MVQSSLTVAGCNLSPAPGSKGGKLIISFSADSHDSSKNTSTIYNCLSDFQFEESRLCAEIGDIIREQNLGSRLLVREKNSVPFVNAKSPMDILNEAKKLNLIGEFTLKELSLLQLEEQNRFSSSKEAKIDKGEFHKSTEGALSVHLKPGHACHFMSRFLITYGVNYSTSNKNEDHYCQFCQASSEREIAIRHMVDADWLFLLKVSRSQYIEKGGTDPDASFNNPEVELSDYMVVSAARALVALRLIPASARRALPVVVNNKDLLLSVPVCYLILL
jgi:tRNA(Ile)-lysidine synthase